MPSLARIRVAFPAHCLIAHPLLLCPRVRCASLAKSHVPYYGSKLTMLLQPALGGSARTTVLVTCSPDKADADETLHALRFGERCRLVESTAVSATASMADILAALDSSVAASEAEVARLVGAGGKAAAEKDAAAMASGTGMASGVKQAGTGVGVYSAKEDVAGAYVAEVERLAVLKRRRRDIVGGGGGEGH